MHFALQTFSLHLAFGRHPDGLANPHKLTLEECLRKACAWGFAGVQIDPMHLLQHSLEYARSLSRLAKVEGLFLELGSAGFSREHIRQELNFADALGARFIRIFDEVAPRPLDSQIIQRKLDFIKGEIESVLPDLERSEITLGWENHADYSTTEQLQVLTQLNHQRFRACIDLGNSMMFLEPPVQTVERLAPFAGGVHFKDYAVTGTAFGLKFYGTALGTGVIPLRNIMQILRTRTDLHHVVYEQPIEPISIDPEESVLHEERTLVKSLRYARDELEIQIS